MLLLTACSDGADKPKTDATSNLHDVLKAATGPLEDLNLTREDIPPQLKVVAQNPYFPPAKMDCPSLKIEVAQLDTLLGPDQSGTITQITYMSDESDEGLISSVKELPNLPSTPTIVNKGANAAHDGILGFIRHETDILPFKSIIRKVSGADRHEQRLKLAYEAGNMRRAYLKGLAEAKYGPDCLMPKVIEAKAVPSATPAVATPSVH